VCPIATRQAASEREHKKNGEEEEGRERRGKTGGKGTDQRHREMLVGDTRRLRTCMNDRRGEKVRKN